MFVVYIGLYTLAFFILLSGIGIAAGNWGNWPFVGIGLACFYFGYWVLRKLPDP